jgi:hypothetical protein
LDIFITGPKISAPQMQTHAKAQEERERPGDRVSEDEGTLDIKVP